VAHISEAAVQEALAAAGWDFGARTLRPHQTEAVVHGLTAANAANFSVPGAGKTASTLGSPPRTCPAGPSTSSSSSARCRASGRGRPRPRRRCRDWAPAVIDIAVRAWVRVILAGTPMPQSGRDLYTQMSVLWPGRELTGTRDRFKSKVANDFDGVLDDVLPFVSRAPKSALGLPDAVVSRQPVPMSDDEAAIYRLVVDHLRRSVQAAGPSEADRLAALRRGRPLRLLQACSKPALLRAGQPRAALAATTTPTLLDRIDAYDPAATPPSKFAAALDLIRALGQDDKAVAWRRRRPDADAGARAGAAHDPGQQPAPDAGRYRNDHERDDIPALQPGRSAPLAQGFAPVSQEMNALPVPWVEARDISNAVLFLASDEARYITGVPLPVDAGCLIK